MKLGAYPFLLADKTNPLPHTRVACGEWEIKWTEKKPKNPLKKARIFFGFYPLLSIIGNNEGETKFEGYHYTMNKKIIIELTSRQLYALAHCSMKKKARREKFGVGTMIPLFNEKLKELVSIEEIESLKNEWLALKEPETIEKKQGIKQNIKSKKVHYATRENPIIRTWNP